MDYSRSIDKVITNRWLGLPIFAALMWLMFKLTYDLGSLPMDWIDAGVAVIATEEPVSTSSSLLGLSKGFQV